MKKATKALLIVLCAVLLVAGSVLGTLAYLTSRDTVTNTFTVGDVEIKVDEENVTEDGKPTPEDDDRVEENEYHLIPGQTYVKDPTMTVVKGSEESYVRMLVTITHIDELKAIFGDDFLPENYVEGWDKEIWECVGVTEKFVVHSNETIKAAVYEFRYKETVDAYESDEDIVLKALFTKFTMPGEITGEQLETIQGLEIVVEGHAIQTASFDDADAAWAAFDAQYKAANP